MTDHYDQHPVYGDIKRLATVADAARIAGLRPVLEVPLPDRTSIPLSRDELQFILDSVGVIPPWSAEQEAQQACITLKLMRGIRHLDERQPA